MTKRKSLIATFAFVLVLSLALVFGITLSGGTLTAQAAGAPSYVTVNAQKLYSGSYLESNESTIVSTGATTEPATYVAWYKDGILTLNGYDGGYISVGGDLTIKLKGENTITSSDKGIFASACENLIIDADSEATLNINVTSSNINVTSSTEPVFGICLGYSGVDKTGAVTIKGKATVNINAETSIYDAYGIYTETGFNIVGSANLSIKNTSFFSTSNMSYSIVSFNNTPLFNTDGVVTLDNSECANRNYCLSVNNGIDMRKGTLICRYKPGEIYSYAFSQAISTAPEDYVIREEPYYLGETVIKSGVGHTVTVENGTDYYGKNSNQYVAGETVKIKPSIADLPFNGWEGAGITFADATKKETSFVMGDEDVTIKAIYDVFAKQPVFERINNKKGSISVQLNKQVSNINKVKLMKSTGEVDENVSFKFDPTAGNYTYACSSVLLNCTPAGTYKIRVEYNGYYFYSELFEVDYTDKTPAANVSDITVNGKTGREITPVNFDVTLTYATFKAITDGTDVSSWIENLPNGLVAKISAVSEGATSATITISGTPTTELKRELYLTIPTDFLATGNDSAVHSKENANAIFNIVMPASYKVTMTDGKAQVGDKTQTNIEEGLTVKIIANEKSGYVFDKWVVVSDGVTLANENNKETTFVMPESDVEIKATYKKIVYSVEVFVTAPIKDKTADTTTMTVNDTGYSATKVEWYKGEGVVSSKQMGATDKFIAGQNYTVVVTIKLDSGYVFAGDSSLAKSINGQTATLNSGSGTDTITIKTTFIVPTDPIPEHSVTVENGTLESGATTGNFAEGSSVTVSANDPASDMMFDKWTATGITLTSEQLSSQTFTFTMGTNDVTLTATYKAIPKYTVMVENGKLADSTTSGSFKAGESITITADAKEGYTFDKWVVSGITLSNTDLAKSTLAFAMPANDVTFKATYKDIVYRVTVEEGTATPEMATYQTEVTVTANAPAADMYFDKWEVTGLDTTGMDLTKTEIKFQMPANDVTFKATYLAYIKYEIVVVDGTKDKSPVMAGETVTITANPAPSGKVFDKWTCETAGVTIEFANATSSTTTFVMPACEITIQAHFRNEETAPSVEIKVEGGTGAGTYKPGDSVTITANEPAEGKVFKGWKDDSGNIVSTDKAYTFTVNGETTLTAVYEDKPSGGGGEEPGGEIKPTPDNKGLSDGAIAGIVVGSVAVAGIGGFAIFWFVIKKKSFADLIAAIKGLFKKK